MYFPNNGKEPPKGLTSEQTQEILKIWQKYQGKDSQLLMNDIFETVNREKAAGRLTNDQIINFVKQLSPFLNNAQRQNINDLVKRLTQD